MIISFFFCQVSCIWENTEKMLLKCEFQDYYLFVLVTICCIFVKACGSLKFEFKGTVLGSSRPHHLFLGKPCVSRLKGYVYHALQQTPGCTTAVLAAIKSLSNITVCC